MRFIMEKKYQNKTGIVILVAGNSSRLGRPKQLLKFKESTLLKNTILEALKVPNSFVIVVTGANKELIQKEIYFKEINLCYNPDWETGMASSIAKGISELIKLHPDYKRCILAVCDQPFVTAVIFESLISNADVKNKGIAASVYSETLGTPVLFHQKYFKELLELEGQEGAKKLIKKYSDDVVAVPFAKGNIDIDTEEDYKKLFR